MSVIKFEDAAIYGGQLPVLLHVNMEIDEGEFVYIMGRVGSGKTSLIRTLTAEQSLADGKCTVCGMDLSTLKSKQIPQLRRKLGVVFQDFQLLTDRNVHDNLEFVLRATGWKPGRMLEDRIEYTLDAVGMSTKAHKMPFQLSGGEQQRVAIARALLNDPAVVLADEPTGNLDEDTAEEIMQLLKYLNGTKGVTIVMVTHNRRLTEEHPAGRIYRCLNGTITG